MTFEIFDQSDEETWPDQKKDNDKYKDKHNDKDKHNIKDKYISRAHSKSDPRDLWALRHLIRVMRGHDLTKRNTMTKANTKTKTITKTMTKTIPETCDIWDTNYNSDNWEPEFMTIFVAWQLRVTLDSIRNSCDVFTGTPPKSSTNRKVMMMMMISWLQAKASLTFAFIGTSMRALSIRTNPYQALIL